MATFYDVRVEWKDGTTSQGRGIGNIVAWKCRCGGVLLGPHEDLYAIPPCPGCGLTFRILRGTDPQFVGRVIEE